MGQSTPNAVPLPGKNSYCPAEIQSTKNNLLPFKQNPAFTKAGTDSYIFQIWTGGNEGFRIGSASPPFTQIISSIVRA
jgi:hypothetical protein